MSRTTTDRLKIVPDDKVAPFAVLLDPPIPGESLLGFTNRCFARTPAKQAVQALRLAGIGKLTPTGLSTTLDDPVSIAGLAKLLRTTVTEIESRLHRPGMLASGRSAAIDFFGTMIRPDYRESKLRRVSPRALAVSPHHRAVWDLRIFGFDPETREKLIEACPVCGTALGWRRAYGIQNCEWCLDEDGSSKIDLRDFPQEIVEVSDDAALRLMTDLVDPDAATRDRAARQCQAPWEEMPPSELFETAVAVACALTMKPDGRRTTLERPKTVESYARFTPEVLAAAGRFLLDGTRGFDIIADKIRADAGIRSGFYGVKKELLPLFCLTVDQHLTAETKKKFKVLIKHDMERTRTNVLLRRADYATDQRFQPIDTLTETLGVPRRALSRLARSNKVEVVTAGDAKQAPKMMAVAEIAALAEIFKSAIHRKNVAGLLGIPQDVLADLESRGMITPIDGPVTEMFDSDETYYRKPEVEALAERMHIAVADGARLKRKPLRVSKAVKRLGMTPIPWGAVVAAVAKGTATLVRMPGDNKTWRTGAGTADIRGFLRAVQAELCDTDAVVPDEWIGNQTVAELLGISEVFVSLLANAGRIRRKGTSSLRLFERREIEAFGRKYIFVAEIQERAAIPRARDVRTWLGARGVRIAFELAQDRYLAFDRSRVERVLAEEAQHALQAAK